MHSKKIAIIGLDGANRTTARLIGIDSPQIHDFISTIPPYTPPSWTSILTGVNPAKHGIIGWQKVDLMKNHVSFYTSRDVKYPRLSELLESANLKSILINLPITYPFSGIKRKDNTIIVSDWAAPEQTIFPKKLETKYREYLLDPPHEWAKHGKNKREYSKKVKEYTETRLNIYHDLLEKEKWNLYFIVFSEIDWFSHLFPEILNGENTQLVKPTFKLINEFIETVKSIADFVFIVSDHGFEIKEKIFYVNVALAENGFIKYNKTKAKIIDVAKKVMPRKVLQKTLGRSRYRPISYTVQDFDAIMVEPATWGIYVKNKDKITDMKNSLTNYDEIFDVIELKKIYRGPYTSKMPDLIVIPKRGVKFSHEFKKTTVEKTYIGDHEIHGIFSAYGDCIKDSIIFEKRPRVYDIAPTVLHILGLPIPANLDGRVLMEIFNENSEIAQRRVKNYVY